MGRGLEKGMKKKNSAFDWNLILKDFFAMNPLEAALSAADNDIMVARHMLPYFIRLAVEWRKQETHNGSLPLD
jgi:hypothetical protein